MPTPAVARPGRSAARGSRDRQIEQCRDRSWASRSESPRNTRKHETHEILFVLIQFRVFRVFVRFVSRYPFRTFTPPLPASGFSFRSSPRLGITILNCAISVAAGGPPGRPWSVGPAGRSPVSAGGFAESFALFDDAGRDFVRLSRTRIAYS